MRFRLILHMNLALIQEINENCFLKLSILTNLFKKIKTAINDLVHISVYKLALISIYPIIYSHFKYFMIRSNL